MQMRGAVSKLVMGTVRSLKWRSVFTKAQYSGHFSSSLCLKPYRESSPLGSHGRTSMPMTLLLSLNRSRNVSEGSWLGKKQWKRKDRVNAGKTKIMICGIGLDLLQRSGEFPCAACRTGVGSNKSATAASTGCTRNAVGSSAWQRTIQMYTVPGNCTPLGRQTTERNPSRTWQAGGGSFLWLPRRHALSSRWLTAWKKFKELLPVLISRHLSFKTRGCVYSSYVRSAMLHSSETWPLSKPKLQRLQRNNRAMIRQLCNVRPQDVVTTRSSEILARLGIEDLDLILNERRLRWYRRGTLRWCSQDSLSHTGWGKT